MSEVKVNKISPRTNCGTVQLGDSGDTITIPAGATITNNGTQTGFGRTGAVDWDTTAKTASFTAVSGTGYFVDTSGGAVTMTLPATPSAGDIVSIADYSRTFATNNVTVARNGSNIQGIAADGTFSTNGQSTTFVYVDGTQGWVPTEDQTTGLYGALYVTATGGTVTCCGDYKIHTFTSPGTFTVTCAGNPAGSDTVDYLVVAGGGGGGDDLFPAPRHGGGGGAGGFRLSNSTCMPAPLTSPLANPTGLPVTAQGYPITVGGGGIAGNPTPGPTVCGGVGSNSVFSTITSAGGGGGIGHNTGYGVCQPNPASGSGLRGGGGSGGGEGCIGCNPYTPGRGEGNSPPTNPPQENPSGRDSGKAPLGYSGSGGGGAGAVGGNATPGPTGGAGGIGSFVVSAGFAGCNGTPGPVGSTRYFAGGGGAHPGGAGGSGGGASANGNNGTANTGGGGGGNRLATAGAGGSGIVIIRYKYQ